MKHFFVIQMALVVNFLFHLNTILVTGQVALSRHWLRGKFSDQKTEMNLLNTAGSLSGSGNGNGMPSDFGGNGNVGNVNSDSDGDGYAPQFSPLRQPPLKRMNGKMLKRLRGGQNFEDGLETVEGNEILVMATDADNNGGNQGESGNNVYENTIRNPISNFVPNPNKHSNSVSWISKGAGKPDVKRCRAIFMEAMDSWGRNNYCNCVQ